MPSIHVRYNPDTGHLEEDDEFDLLKKLVINNGKLINSTVKNLLKSDMTADKHTVEYILAEHMSDLEELENYGSEDATEDRGAGEGKKFVDQHDQEDAE